MFSLGDFRYVGWEDFVLFILVFYDEVGRLGGWEYRSRDSFGREWF